MYNHCTGVFSQSPTEETEYKASSGCSEVGPETI